MRVKASQIDQDKREERQRSGRRMRVGFQVVVLALIVALAFILVFPTAQRHSAQQVEKERWKVRQAEAQAQVNELQDELDRWEDPAFIKAQARKRLSYVMPGETSYRVSDPENAPAPPVTSPPAPEPSGDQTLGPEEDLRAPWYFELWDSTIQAGLQ